MSDTIGYVLIGVLALLAIQEIIRYRRCQQNTAEIPYPRRSLSRRLAITLDFIAILLLVMFWPKAAPIVQLIMMGLIGVAALTGFFLLWRDLRETSMNVVEHATKLNEDAGRDLSKAILNKRQKENPSGPPHETIPPNKTGQQSETNPPHKDEVS